MGQRAIQLRGWVFRWIYCNSIDTWDSVKGPQDIVHSHGCFMHFSMIHLQTLVWYDKSAPLLTLTLSDPNLQDRSATTSSTLSSAKHRGDTKMPSVRANERKHDGQLTTCMGSDMNALMWKLPSATNGSASDHDHHALSKQGLTGSRRYHDGISILEELFCQGSTYTFDAAQKNQFKHTTGLLYCYQCLKPGKLTVRYIKIQRFGIRARNWRQRNNSLSAASTFPPYPWYSPWLELCMALYGEPPREAVTETRSIVSKGTWESQRHKISAMWAIGTGRYLSNRGRQDFLQILSQLRWIKYLTSITEVDCPRYRHCLGHPIIRHRTGLHLHVYR